MEIRVNNFGPIQKASIKLTPLTVIIGQNNKGKSFISQLVYSIVTSLQGSQRKVDTLGLRSIGLIELPQDFIADELYQELQINKQFRKYINNEIDRDSIITTITQKVFFLYSEFFKKLFQDELETTFGVKIKDLVRFGANRSIINIILSPVFHLHITITKGGLLSSELKYENTALSFIYNNKNLIPSIESVRTKRLQIKHVLTIIRAIHNLMKISPEIKYPYYLPAGRGGLIDSWETISSAWVNLAPVSIPRGINMPPLPGTSSKFYNILQSLTGRLSGNFTSACESFRSILNGDIKVYIDRTSGGKRYISYTPNLGTISRSINIIHTASMIKELGPLYLLIREVIEEKDLFIVEEPESHLHPTAQRDFISIIVDLVQQGLNSLFTTHSDILLRTLAHYVYRSSTSRKRNRLSMLDLSIYLITDGAKGSVTKPVKIGKKGTLNKLPSFDEVIEELYDEEMRFILSNS